jgi:hypothetical protein
MRQFPKQKVLTNERKYPNIVELTFPADGLEFENSTVGLLNFISPDTFNRGTGVRLLGRSEPILGGALPIWGRLATSLNSLAGPWPKLGFERHSPTMRREGLQTCFIAQGRSER